MPAAGANICPLTLCYAYLHDYSVLIYMYVMFYWVFFSQAGQKVENLYEDFKDGSKLLILLELLTNEKLVCTD